MTTQTCTGTHDGRACNACRSAPFSCRSDACHAAYAAELRAGIDDGESASRSDGLAARRFDHQRNE